MRNGQSAILAVVVCLLVAGAVSGVASAVVFTDDSSTATNAQMQQPRNGEPNDSRQNATPIEEGDTRDTKGTVSSGEVDWYSFHVSGGEVIRLSPNTFNNITPTFTLYAPDGTVLVRKVGDGTDPDYEVAVVAAVSGTYYVQVTGTDTNHGDYSFSLWADQQENEPNDDRQDATPMLSSQAYGAVNSSDVDWYSFRASAGETIRLEAYGDESVTLTLYTPNGTALARASANASPFKPLFTVVAPQSGTYYIKATGTDAYHGVYGFSVKTFQNRPNNDNRENATPLSLEPTSVEGISQAFADGLGPDEQEDWFAFEVEAGQAIRAWAYASPMAAGAANVTIVGPDGKALADVSLGIENYPSGVVAEESGTYYIHMVNTSDIGPVGYNVTVQVAETGQWEPNDKRKSAAPFTPGEQITTTLVPGSETDWYVVEANEGATINATLVAVPKENLPSPVLKNPMSVDIFTANGTRIGEAVEGFDRATNTTSEYQGPTTATVVAESVEEGTYYIRVAGGDEYTTAFSSLFGFSLYSLTVSGEGLTSPTMTTPKPTETQTQTPSDSETNTITIKGTGPVVSYTFAASNISPGEKADVEDNTDQIDGSVVHGSTGKNGIDTYRFTGQIQRFESDHPGTLVMWINGTQVEPTALGDSKQTATPTATPTPTPTETPTPTATATPIPTRTATNSATAVSTSTTPTENRTATSTENKGRILGGTETETKTTSSSGPGFGVIGAVCALLAAALFIRRR